VSWYTDMLHISLYALYLISSHDLRTCGYPMRTTAPQARDNRTISGRARRTAVGASVT